MNEQVVINIQFVAKKIPKNQTLEWKSSSLLCHRFEVIRMESEAFDQCPIEIQI